MIGLNETNFPHFSSITDRQVFSLCNASVDN